MSDIETEQRLKTIEQKILDRIEGLENRAARVQEQLAAIEKWQDNAAPVLQQVRARWHLPGPRCQVHGKRNCALCFERGLTT